MDQGVCHYSPQVRRLRVNLGKKETEALVPAKQERHPVGLNRNKLCSYEYVSRAQGDEHPGCSHGWIWPNDGVVLKDLIMGSRPSNKTLDDLETQLCK